MAKRKFLICFPYEGDVKKIDKIADALESEGIDFMQVDGETPSGEFVSVAKGDIDEVKEDIAEIPGFEGTMEALDDLTIMPTEGEFTDVEFPESDEDFIARLKANPDADKFKNKQKVRVNLKFDDYVKDALGPDADVSSWWVEGTWLGLDMGPSDDMPVVVVDYDEELVSGMKELFPELSDDEAWEKVQGFCYDKNYNCDDGEIWIPLKPDFTTDDIRQPFPKDEDDLLELDDSFDKILTYRERDKDFIAKLKANPDDDEFKYKQKVLVNLKFTDQSPSPWWVEGVWQGLEGPSDNPVVETDLDSKSYNKNYDLKAVMKKLYPELSDGGEFGKIRGFCDGKGYLCDDGIIWVPLKPDFTTDDIRHPESDILNANKIIATDTTEEVDRLLGKSPNLEGWDLDGDNFFKSKFYQVYEMWNDGFVDRISDLGDIDRVNELSKTLRFEKMNLKNKIIEDKLESYPEIETFYIDETMGTWHFKLTDFPDIDITATPGWNADDYETLLSVPVSLGVVDYDGVDVNSSEIPEEYKKEKYIIKDMESEVLWNLGAQADNNNSNPFSLLDPVWNPAQGKYIDYEVYADLYYRKVVEPLLNEMYKSEESYRIDKEDGMFSRGGGIGYQEINKGKKITKKPKQDNSALIGGLAGLVFGIFLNR